MTAEQYAKHRKRLRLSHVEMAARLGIVRSTSWKYEQGALPIPVVVALAVKGLK